MDVLLFMLLIATITNALFIEGFVATTCLPSRAPCVSGASILHVASITDNEQQHRSETPVQPHNDGYQPRNNAKVNIVLVTGFESFNRDLYEKAGESLPKEFGVNLKGE